MVTKTTIGYRGKLFPEVANQQYAFDIIEIDNDTKEIIRIVSHDL